MKAPLIGIDGALITGVPSTTAGLRLLAASSQVVALSITTFKVPSYTNGVEGAGIIIGASSCSVKKCYLGLAPDGVTYHGNDSGIRIDTGGAIIGAPGEGNVISANFIGIANWSATPASTIQNNIVGMTSNGMGFLPNAFGIYANGDWVINNRIAFNRDNDLVMIGNGGVIQGNSIGVLANGNAAQISNTRAGIQLYHTNDAIVGGSQAGEANEIESGHWAIYLRSAQRTQIIGNRIHENAYAMQFETSSNTTIAGNTIFSNTFALLMDVYSRVSEIRDNSMYGNGVPVQHGLKYPLPNDSGDADLIQNHPELTSVTSLNGVTKIQGTLNSTSSSTFRLDFYSSPLCNASGFGEGKVPIASTTVTTDAAGNAAFNLTLSLNVSSGDSVTATATNSQKSTSEFSKCFAAEGAGAFKWLPQSVKEGDTITIPVQRVNGSVGTATVSYATANDTAIAGSDFTAAAGTLTFADGETQKIVTIPTIDDNRWEPVEYFSFTLSNPTGGTAIIAPFFNLITITDNEPHPGLLMSNISVIEGNSGTTNASFSVRLSTPYSVSKTFHYYGGGTFGTGPADTERVEGNVTFAPGEAEKTIVIPVIGDVRYEPDEHFSLIVTDDDLMFAEADCTIVNDDVQPTLNIEDLSVTEGNNGTKIANVVLRATGPVDGIVTFLTVDGTAKAGSDYQQAASFLKFDNETEKSISLVINSDTDVEPNETFQVNISPYQSSAKSGRSSATVTVLNDDLGIGPQNQAIAKGRKGNVSISLGVPSASDETIVLSSSSPTALSVPSSMRVPAGARFATFEISALDAPASARIQVTLPSGLGGGAFTVSATSYENVALELQPSPITVIAGASVNVTARLTPAATEPQVIALQSTDPSLVDVPSTITIPAGGSTTFTLNALQRGGVTLRATLPPRYGSETTLLFVDIIDTPTTPVLFSVSPAAGPVAGGTAVSISGAKLRGDCTLLFGTVPVQPVFVSETELRAVTPPNRAGSVDVRISCGADAFSLANGFSYLGTGPAITDVTPSSGNVDGTTIVKLTGTNLSGACGVFFDGIAARGVEADGSTTLHAIAPAHAAGSVDVQVRCGRENATRNAAYEYASAEEPSAEITGVDPLTGSTGQSVTISGLRFRAGDRVTFGTTRVVILSTTGDTHVVTIPDLPAGKVAITISDPNNRVTTTGPIFTIVEAGAPQITRATPSTVIAGNELVVEGDGFRSGYGFALGDRAASIISMSYARAVIRVPAIDAGTYPLNIITAAGNVAAIGPSITVASHGVAISGVSTSCGSTDGGETITIRGSGFSSGASVTFAGIAATNVIVIDANTITATIPGSSNAGAARIVITNANGDSGSLTGAFRYVSPFDPDGCGAMRRRVGSRG